MEFVSEPQDPVTAASQKLISTHSDSPYTQVLICALCNKPFNKQRSYRRHVQYCAGRSSRGPYGRSRACEACSRSKVKCDFRAPCSKCASRKIECTYNEGHVMLASRRDSKNKSAERSKDNNISGTSGDDSEFHVDNSDSIFATPIEAITNESLSELQSSSDMRLQLDEFSTNGAIQDDWISGTQKTVTWPSSFEAATISPTSWNLPTDTELNISTMAHSWKSAYYHTTQLMNGSGFEMIPAQIAGTPAMPRVSTALELANNTTVNQTQSIVAALLARPISNGCRGLIASVICSYPRMLLQQDRLPPFIHHFGAGLHFDLENSLPIQVSSTNSIVLLEPMAICSGIAQIFYTRTSRADQFLELAVVSEEQRIQQEYHRFTLGETLAAIQALVIYIIMRFDETDSFEYLEKTDTFGIMKALIIHFTKHFPGAFCTIETYSPESTWQRWIYDETRRRILNVCFMVSLLAAPRCDPIVDPDLIPLPSNKALWEAKNVWDWQIEYRKAAQNHKSLCCELRTMGDLVCAQHGLSHCWEHGSTREALKSWTSEIDGLGLMLLSMAATI